MKKLFALAAVATMTLSLPTLAAETGSTTDTKTTHTADSMSSGHHMMPGNKQTQMSNKMMPSMNPKCADDEAVAKMPADHRAACHKK